jgi:hypothetical protein
MKRTVFAILAVSTLTIGCGNKTSSLPNSPSSVGEATDPSLGSQTLAAAVANSTWTGTSTTGYPATGHSGSASVTFTTPGGPQNGDVAATIVWTLNGTSVVFNGSASGTVDNILLDAPESQTHGCSTYSAHGTVIGNVFTGTYSATCHHAADAILGDAGTFILNRVIPPVEPPVDPPTTFCHVPVGNPAGRQTLIAPLSAIQQGHIPQHPDDYYGACLN